ncbi:MAG TPA: hypothetical protein VGQ41_16785 [Pyrinomonadaceae bacterium]|jgi:hypothetical protein|nr:hypothetical protein [Pyrinomonadaceae bacterium]
MKRSFLLFALLILVAPGVMAQAAVKDGKFISTWMQLEYGFNLD